METSSRNVDPTPAQQRCLDKIAHEQDGNCARTKLRTWYDEMMREQPGLLYWIVIPLGMTLFMVVVVGAMALAGGPR
ncbi:MAG TPA: hypothetical protein VJ757_01410 [Pseudonocardiaceae bacterium]|nr:hypothetical protein [Pseudonocardiaceae bacterium]